MNKRFIERRLDNLGISLEEVAVLPPHGRVLMGLPPIIPQTDYNFTQRLVEDYLPRIAWLRKLFGLDQPIDLEPPFQFDDPGLGRSYCFTGDTKIPLVDGTEKTIKELAALGIDAKFLVYSLDTDFDLVVSREAFAFQSGKDAHLVEVEINNGSKTRCTPDHLWMLRDGAYREAKSLKPGDTLYSRLSHRETQHFNVASVRAIPDKEDVYDINVEGTRNFAILSGVFVHNSWYNAQLAFELNRRSVYHLVEEMDNFDLCAATLDTYSEDATQTDSEYGRSVWIESENDEVRRECMNMLDRLGIEDTIFGICRGAAKYGDDFEQVIVSQDMGVVSLEFVSPHRLTRVQDRFGRLIGFAPGIHTDDEIKNPDKWKKLRKSRPWDFVHFRITSSRREMNHGESILMNARRCLAAGTPVWTTEGPVAIEDLRAGDHQVIVFDTETGETHESDVNAVMDNGVRQVYRVESRHRSVTATDDHPILVKAISGELVYKEVKDLIVDSDSLVMPVQTWGASTHEIRVSPDNYRVRLKEPVDTGEGVMARLRDLDLSTSLKRAHSFLKANVSTGVRGSTFTVPYLDYLRLRNVFDLPEKVEISYYRSYRPAPVDNNLTFQAGEDFCYLLGFMLGDGWVEKHVVGVALGVDEDLNDKVRGLFSSLFDMDDPTLTEPIPGVRGGVIQYTSSALAELFCAAGFITGFANKRVPPWVFGMDAKCRYALVRGLLDADGGKQDKGYRISLSNKGLMLDLHMLCQGLGLWVSKEIAVIDRPDRKRAYRIWVGSLDTSDTACYEAVCRVTPVGKSRVHDIEVADKEHNFVANGGVAHNCWRQLKIIEDTLVLYRLNRATDKDIYYVDTGTQTMDQQWQTVNQWRRELRKRFYVNTATGQMRQQYNPRTADEDLYVPMPKDSQTRIERLRGSQPTGRIYDVDHFRDKFFGAVRIPKAYLGFEKDINCFGLSTRIPCLDGESRSLGQIISDYEDTGNLPYVYSCDGKGKIVPGEVTWAGITRENARVVKVTLDDGSQEVCTPDHLWMLRDGRYKRADKLVPGDSLMPLYRSVDGKGYEKVKHNHRSNSWQHTHRMVMQTCDRLRKAADKIYRKREVAVVHHEDFCKHNNDPRNLSVMERQSHLDYHGTLIDVERATENLHKYREAHGVWNKGLRKGDGNPKSSSLRKKNFITKVCVGCGAEFSVQMMERNRKYCSLECSRSHQASFVGDGIRKSKRVVEGWVEKTCEACGKEFKVTKSRSAAGRGRFCSRDCKSAYSRNRRFNHKVARVDILEGRIDTGDITVAYYCNFAVSSGVFVHNSKATLSQQDIRFARGVKRVQRAIKHGITNLCRFHLAWKDMDPVDAKNRFKVCMASINYLDELARSEMWTLRQELTERLLSMGVEVVKDQDAWVRYTMKRFLTLNDDEINQFMGQRLKGQELNLGPEKLPQGYEKSTFSEVDHCLSKVVNKARLLKEAAGVLKEDEVKKFEPAPGEEEVKDLKELKEKEKAQFYDLEVEEAALGELLEKNGVKRGKLKFDCPNCELGGRKESLIYTFDEAEGVGYVRCRHCGFVGIAEGETVEVEQEESDEEGETEAGACGEVIS